MFVDVINLTSKNQNFLRFPLIGAASSYGTDVDQDGCRPQELKGIMNGIGIYFNDRQIEYILMAVVQGGGGGGVVLGRKLIGFFAGLLELDVKLDDR